MSNNVALKPEMMPENLAVLGKGILVVLASADKAAYDYEVKTQTAAAQVLEAKEICDRNKYSFAKFAGTIGLGKSRAYELLAIASGEKTVDDVRKATAARQRKLQQKRKAEAEAAKSEQDDDEDDAPATKKAKKTKAAAKAAFNIDVFMEEAEALVAKKEKDEFLNWLHDSLVHICDANGIEF